MAATSSRSEGGGRRGVTTPSSSDRPAATAAAYTNGGGSASARATAMTIGLVLVSRVLGVVRNMVLSHLFGQNAHTSQYWAAFGVPDLIALVIAGGGLSSVFIPVFAEYWNAKREDDAWRVFGSVMCIVMAVIAVLVVAMEIGVVPLTSLLNREFTPGDVRVTAHLSAILLPAQWFLIVGGFMMGTLYARKRFFVPALGPVIYNLGTILGGLTQWGSPHPTLSSLAWGTLVGALVGSFLLPLFELLRIGARWYPGFDTGHEGVRKIGRLMIPVLLGLSLGQLIMWITQRCLPADGRMTALKNAYDLTQAPIGIFAQAFAIVLLPTISNLAAQQDWKAFRRAISQGIRRVLFLTIPASLLMSALALPLVRLIYKGGMYTEANAHVAATALLCYSLGTFAWSALAILARGFYARQDTWTPILITTPMVFLFFVLARIAVVVQPHGFTGLALAASAVGTLTMLLFLFLLQKRVGGLRMDLILSSTLRILLASAVASWVAYRIFLWFDARFEPDKMTAAVTLIVAGGVGIALYAVICFLLRVPELFSLGEMFRRPRGSASTAAAASAADTNEHE